MENEDDNAQGWSYQLEIENQKILEEDEEFYRFYINEDILNGT